MESRLCAVAGEDTVPPPIQLRHGMGPPIELITAMAKTFPLLRFDLHYFESGMGFQGTFEIQGMDILKDDHQEYFGNRGG